jgi:hypothetical protein
LTNFRTSTAFLDPDIATHRALPHLYPLSLCTPKIRECDEPGKRGGSHWIHGCSMDAQTVGGG